MPNNEPNESNRNSLEPTRIRFSITSGLVLTAVFATAAASLAHLVRAANGDQEAIGRFVIVTAMSPLLLLAVTSLIFRIRKIIRE